MISGVDRALGVGSVAMFIVNLLRAVEECRDYPEDGSSKRLQDAGYKLRISWLYTFKLT